MSVTPVVVEAGPVDAFRGYDELRWISAAELARFGTSALMKKLIAGFDEAQTRLPI